MALIFAPIQRAQAQSLNSVVAGGMFVARAAAVGGAAVAFAPTAVLGVGLALAAFYVYDKYVSPNSSSLPSDTPVAQINVDGQSRLLTQAEKDAGFTNPTALGQSVTPPNTSIAYPPLFGTAAGPVANGGPINGAANACTQTLNTWQSSANGTAQYITTRTNTPPGKVDGYAAPSQISDCMSGGLQYAIWVQSNRCALGYSGTGCTLANSSQVLLPKDGTCQIGRSGNVYSLTNQDPDCTPQAGKSSPVPVITNNGGTVSFISKPDVNGKPSILTVDSSNGATTITAAIPNVSTPTYTNSIVKSTAIDPVTGKTTVTTVTTTTTTGVGPEASVVVAGGGGSSPVTVDIPSNLAKTEDINKTTEAVKDLAKAPVDPFQRDPNIPDAPSLDPVTSAVGTGDSLPSIFTFGPTFPPSVEPPPISFKINGQVVVLDVSAWVARIRNYLGILIYVLTPFILFSIVVGARKED